MNSIKTVECDSEAAAKQIVQDILLGDSSAGIIFPQAFEGDSVGWEFTTQEPMEFDAVSVPPSDRNPDRHLWAVVGAPNEDGILWRGGAAFVVDGGREDVARQGAIGMLAGCSRVKVRSNRFMVVRGFCMSGILVIRLEETQFAE